jgi:hybrid cluster-associated redox disulfide protein
MTEKRERTKPAITAETTMGEALRADPNLPAVLMRFHIGGCTMCGFEENDTVAQVAEDNGVPVERLLEALNGG